MGDKTMSHLVFYSFSMLLMASKSSATGILFDQTDDKAMVNNCTNESYSDYCNQIGECEPGSHIMCVYYRTGTIMGPVCSNGRMIKFTYENIQLVLKLINEIRASMSSGNVTGRNNALLPKAKSGLPQLEWDTDLSLFAQVWANQCRELAEDPCRATETFPSPGQAVALVKYVYEKPKQDVSKLCIMQSTVTEAIENNIANWQRHKEHVTPETIQNYKGIEKINGIFSRNNFLTMVNGNTTHIGCAMSSYDSYRWAENEGRHDQTAIELVCNFSAQPVVGKPLYELVEAPEPMTEATDNVTSSTTNTAVTYEKNDTDDTTAPSINTTSPSDLPSNLTNSPTNFSSTNSPPTNSPNNQSDQITSPSSNETSNTPEHNDCSSDESHQEAEYGNLNGTGQRPAVLILPIITVEEAPSDKYLQTLRLINQKLRGYSKKVFSSTNFLDNMNKLTIEKPQTSKKGSIFTRVPTFHLPSQNHYSKYEEHSQENVSLRNKMKALLEQVPKKDLSRLEEALKLLKKTRSRRVNRLSTISTLVNTSSYNEVNLNNTVVPKIQNIDLTRLRYDTPDKIINETDDALLNNTKGLLKGGIDHGKETSYMYDDKTKYEKNQSWLRHSKTAENSIRDTEKDDKWNVNTVLEKNKHVNRDVEVQSQYDIPVIRNQIPIVHAKENNIFDENYSKVQMQGYLNLYKNDKSFSNNYMKDSNVQQQARKYIGGGKIALDDSKLKRRMYLENEINKLKRKLQHLRQYIRQNDITENDRFRPVVKTHNRRRNIKLKGVENFYMPDRAHSLHEF